MATSIKTYTRIPDTTNSSSYVSILSSITGSSGYTWSVPYNQDNSEKLQFLGASLISSTLGSWNTKITKIRVNYEDKVSSSSVKAHCCFWLGRSSVDGDGPDSSNNVFTMSSPYEYYDNYSSTKPWNSSSYTVWKNESGTRSTSFTSREVILYSNTDNSGVQLTAGDFSSGGRGLIIGLGTVNNSMQSCNLTVRNMTVTIEYEVEETTTTTTYTIQFNGNGHTGGSIPSAITATGTSTSVTMGDISSSVPTRTGYTFRGWSSTSSYSSKRIAYTTSAGGEADRNNVSATITGSSWTYQSYCTYTGYTGTSTTLTLYAQWEADTTATTYTIQFDGNGHTGGSLPSTITKTGTSTAVEMGDISSSVPTRTGYTFRGWSSTSSYSQKRIAYNTSQGGGADRNNVSATTTQSSWTYQNYCDNTGASSSSTTLTLYAQWEVDTKTYTIQFNGNGHTGGSIPSAITAEGTSTAVVMGDISSSVPTKTGYIFRGWSSTSSYSSKRIAYGGSYGGSADYNNVSATTTQSSWTYQNYCDNTGYTGTSTTLTLYAQWEDDTTYTLTVTGDLNGYDSYSSISPSVSSYSHRAGDTISLSATLKSGYDIMGWVYKKDSETSWTYIVQNSLTGTYTMPAANVSIALYTKRITTTYTIQFDGNGYTGGSIPSTITAQGTSTSVTMGNIGNQVPTRTGYTFRGWSSTSSYSSKRIAYGGSYGGNADSNNVSATATGSGWTYQNYCDYTGYTGTSTTLTLYAQWEKNTYTVSYDKGTYGSGTNTTDTKIHGTTLTLKGAIFTRTGYTQTGWASNKAGTTLAYNLNANYTTNAAVTLYPYWTIDTYTVSYVDNYGATVPSVQTKTYGINLTLSSTKPSRTGYTFSGWDTDPSADTVVYTAGATYSANTAVTLYAVWTINSHQFTLGSATHVNTTGSTASGSKQYGSTITLKATVDAGYGFAGWTSSNTSLISNQSSANVSFSMPDGAITMTPSVSANQYTITYDIASNANSGDTLTNKPSTQTYTYTGGTVTITPTTPKRTGYIFKGWCRNKNSTSNLLDSGATIDQETGNITLYAVWEKSITIQYNINEGTGATPTQQTISVYNTATGTSFGTLATNTGFSRSGYTFDGWSTTKNDSSTKVSGTTTFTNSTTTLYALWNINYYSVSTNIYTNGVDADNGNSISSPTLVSGSIQSGKYAYGSVIKIIATAVDPYDFESWKQNNIDQGTGTLSDNNNKSEHNFTITEDTTIIANFATGTISARFYCYDITSGSSVLQSSTTSKVKLWVRSKAATASTYGAWEKKTFSTKMTYNDSTYIQVLIENGEDYEFNSGSGINFSYTIPNQLTDILIQSDQSFSIPCKKIKTENHIKVNDVLKTSGYIKDPYFSMDENIASIWIGDKQIMGRVPSKIYPYKEDSLLIDTLYINNQNYKFNKSYKNNTSIKKVIIPQNITTIVANHLDGCSNIRTVKFLQGSQLTSLESYCFRDNSNLLKIYFPDKLSDIGPGALWGCTRLQKVILPKTILTIQQEAFYGCSNLQSLKLNHTKITTLPYGVFSNCLKLKTIFLPKTLTTIENYVFYKCDSLEKIIYMGTIEDWNKITIASQGNKSYLDGVPIQCIDGITYTNLK